ncbi:addiction module toxin, HicA family protein [Synergistales bacterium]|nr:addiction module toxin, HicA family protein [Synergistales bacterium]
MASSKEIIKILNEDGWFYLKANGDHHYFKHLTKLGKVTVPHPTKDVNIKTYKKIMKQAGLP